jgi:hypothetical protein
MQVRTACEAGDGLAPARRRAGARARSRHGVLADDGHDQSRSLAGGKRSGARQRGGVCAAQVGAEVVSVGPDRRGRAGDPRRTGDDELGVDAIDVALWPAPLDDLEGLAPPRLLAAAAVRVSSDQPSLRMGRGRCAVAHRRLLGAQVRPPRSLGDRRPLAGQPQSRGGQDRGHRRRGRPQPSGLLRAA